MRQTTLWTQLQANRLASSSKRLDLVAAQVARVLHLAGAPSLKGKTCLEIGCGWVLSHTFVFHLLGAKRVIATDIAPIAHPNVLSRAVGDAHPATIRDSLSPFCDHGEIRERLNQLRQARHFSFETLKGLSIDYVAPVDLARESIQTPVDFIYSFAVLEHVPINDVPLLLNNLGKNLRSGGMMIHCIHLEDHNDVEHAPFAFLSEPQANFPRYVSQNRGNRIRASEWYQLFERIKDVEVRFLYRWSRYDVALPSVVDSSISHAGEEDLRISHVGLLAIKH
jgi:hypothetical protein